MTRFLHRISFVFLPLFIIALAATGYFARQLGQATPPPLAGPLAAEKGYGLTIDLTTYEDGKLAETLGDLHGRGLTWLRQPVNWAEIESVPGEFEWQALDRIVAAVAQENESTAKSAQKFKLILVLQTSPEWACPPDSLPMTPPTELSDFGHFVRALAVRYGTEIDHYQIWHEPNLSANWGNAFVNPATYADLLREAALNIRTVDPTAHILTAALAPTLEEGPLNLNEMAYLDQLYQAQAASWFDIVAGQPYGFDSGPDAPAQPDRLNFRRLELLRQVMLAHNDAATPIWATAFGWNALPADWAGRPSPWKSAPPDLQAERTVTALAEARRDWPWLGPLLAIRWDATGLAADDPARGFVLAETPVVLEAIETVADQSIATSGFYPPDHPSGRTSPGWRFATTQADIPRREPRTLTISFEGTRLDLHVNRGPYRGYLWVTVDGRPANALPQDGAGRSYVVLYDPLRGSDSVTLAQHLPPGRHEAVIEAEGGWGQWAIVGWTVQRETEPRAAQTGLIIAGLVAGLSGLGLAWRLLQAPLAMLNPLWAFGEIAVALYAIPGERGHLLLTLGLALAFYFASGTVALLFLPLLALTILFRPDLGLALVALSLSFFQVPKILSIGSFSPVELALFLTVTGFIFRALLQLGRSAFASETPNNQSLQLPITNYQLPTRRTSVTNPKSADWAALTLVALALLSTLAAQNFGVSMREWRVVVFESVLFYFLVRLAADFGSPGGVAPPWRWAWRLVDAFVAGAVLQALLALYLYFFTDQSITAEGVRRALGLAYGSPNNLSLFLDRAWPILLAVAVLPGQARLRRGLYGLGLLIVSVALYLTFSKGALLVGLPAGLVAMALLYALRDRQRLWRRAVLIAGGGLVLLGLALIPFSQTERFRTTFDLNQGSTGFFRLKLWQASLAMLRDHWPLGVGLDNFLYAYRTRYILPEAWQEPDLSHPHNLLLDFGTRLGLGGLVLLVWLQVAFWRVAWRLYQTSASPLILGLIGSMVIFLSHGLVDNSYFLVDLAFAFFLTVGLVQGIADHSAERE